ncbi:type I secretion C-terminal target domain (VC_A0849 subclass) [Nitrosospira multiformis]|uniref:Type I secretion C-terminal target domain (VC_A0849 subclass) n=1 Tax=Nitrosospira multiformis TaxID=1231 RepID=A0A1H9YFT4_9PROT|nr:calcium-binding protein [Nitrosospira multiformis]SES67867.1 type I secretion C-terminal target domain (VC_A0849 subclass) [Nitrosospira multiformis]
MAAIYGTQFHDNGTSQWAWNGWFSEYKFFPSLIGTSSSDYIYGYGGNDNLYAYSGNDTLDGGTGTDSMYGGTGNDVYYVDTTTDKVIEYYNQGVDHIYSSVSTNYKWLPANVENLTLTGTAYFGDGNDLSNFISGNGYSNSLYGYGGNDQLYGWGGNDSLDGGAGNDTLVGGAGKDFLTGGTGADTFVFNSVTESPAWGAIDTISDFKWWEGDAIDLSAIDADVNWWATGNQSFSSSQLSYNPSSGLLTADVYGGADLQIALIGASGFNPSLDVIA